MALVIDNQTIPNAPTSRFLKKSEYAHLYETDILEHTPSRMNWIFKHNKAEDIKDELAKILENKYSSLEIINREPEIPVQSKISDIELLDQVGKLDDIGYNDLKKLAVDKYQFKYRETMVKKTKLIEMIQQKKKEKFN